MPYRLLDEVERLFKGHRYLHRKSTQGDLVALRLYEDLAELRPSGLLARRIVVCERVINVQNVIRGRPGRRGDGTFGEAVPHVEPVRERGFLVARGPIASVEIGCEVKILAKAMIKQIDRVTGDLSKQAEGFRRTTPDAICVAIVGVNHAPQYTSYEGRRAFATTGVNGYLHPIQEAEKAEDRLVRHVGAAFDELVILR